MSTEAYPNINQSYLAIKDDDCPIVLELDEDIYLALYSDLELLRYHMHKMDIVGYEVMQLIDIESELPTLINIGIKLALDPQVLSDGKVKYSEVIIEFR